MDDDFSFLNGSLEEKVRSSLSLSLSRVQVAGNAARKIFRSIDRISSRYFHPLYLNGYLRLSFSAHNLSPVGRCVDSRGERGLFGVARRSSFDEEIYRILLKIERIFCIYGKLRGSEIPSRLTIGIVNRFSQE